VWCFERAPSGEQKEIAERALECITGKTSSWSYNRESGLLCAELIESLAPPLSKTLGEPALLQIERAIPKIRLSVDRALAFASLARAASGSEAARLAWTAFLEFSDADKSEQHRLQDLTEIPHLIPAELPPAFRSSPKADKAEKVLQAARGESNRFQFDAMLNALDLEGLAGAWNELTTPPIRLERRLRTLTDTLAQLSRTDPDAAGSMWRRGLDNTSAAGRSLLINYLTWTLPLLSRLVTREAIEEITNDVLDVTSWAWQ
jgi:hypothetical protein